MNKIYLNQATKVRLPYSLNALKVRNFQGIDTLEINDLPCDAQWIFLTGENGFGKTSVLRAIVHELSMNGKVFTPQILKSEGTLDITFLNKSGNIQKINDNDNALPIVGYGISRFNISINKAPDESPVASLFKDDATLESIERELKEWRDDKYNKNRYSTMEELLCKIIPSIEMIEVKEDPKTKKKEVYYLESIGNQALKNLVKFNELATGYRNIIAMVGDMLIRLRAMQDENIDSEDYNNYEGIAIIDEFDAHLHPKYQYELPKLLSSVFPKVQFIVSTHSPIPLLGAPKNSAVVLNVNRTVAEGITIARSLIDFSKLNANAILTSPIFGFDETHFDADTEAASIQPFDNYSEIEENNRIKENIKRLRAKGLIR